MKQKSAKASLVSRITAAVCSAAMLLTSGVSAVNVGAAPAQTDNYAKLLQYSLYFYDGNMCGNTVSNAGRLDWRGDCHTSDEVPGGFHDAGDHVKFGLPAGYTASTLGWSYYEFKDAYQATGQTAHFQAITDHFAQFFKDSTTLSGNTVTKFVYQVGDGDADHAEWCAPEKQGTSSRKTYSTTNGASDIAAEYAAALAVNYINFGNEEDLKYAEALYAFSTKYNKTATNGCQAFYPSTDYADDQAWAAGWLYLATKKENYKSDCQSKQQYIGWVHSWDNVALGAASVYAHITGNWSKVNSYLGGKCSGSNYLFMSEWGSARYNAAMQLCALAATKNSSADYSSWCQGQMSYLLGANPAKTCFVVGLGDNSAKYPHHRGASGYNSYGALGSKTTYGSNGHTLTGALVGGPTSASGAYVDSVQDYQANEVALDYNAGLVGAAAGLYAIYQTGTVDPVSAIPDVKGGVSDTPAVTEPTETTTKPAETTEKPTEENAKPAETVPATEPVTVPQDATEPAETAAQETASNAYSITPGSYSGNFPAWRWSSFGIASGEKPVRVEVKLTASEPIEIWQGSFGSDVTSEGNWYQSPDIHESFSDKSAVIVWEIPSDLAINPDGELKVGMWYSKPGDITIESITVYTDAPAKAAAPAERTEETKPTENAAADETEPTTDPAPVTEVNARTAVPGDADADGALTILDVICVQRWLLGMNTFITDLEAADMNGDGIVDIFDLSLLKNALLNQ